MGYPQSDTKMYFLCYPIGYPLGKPLGYNLGYPLATPLAIPWTTHLDYCKATNQASL